MDDLVKCSKQLASLIKKIGGPHWTLYSFKWSIHFANKFIFYINKNSKNNDNIN